MLQKRWWRLGRKDRPVGAGFHFSLVFSMAISVSVSDFPVSFDFSIGALEQSTLSPTGFFV